MKKRIEIPNEIGINTLSTPLINSFDFCLPSFTRVLVWMVRRETEIAEKMTTQSCVIIPVAIKKASVSEEAPHYAARTDCLIRPSSLIKNVIPVRVIVDNSMLLRPCIEVTHCLY